MKYWKFVFILLAVIPGIYVIALLAYYVHATIILGYAPYYNHPDPKTLSIYTSYSQTIYGTFQASFYLLPVWCLVSFMYLGRYKKENVNYILLGSIIYLMAYLLFKSEIFEWFLD